MCKNVRISLFTLLLILFVSSTLVPSVSVKGQFLWPSESVSVSSALEAELKSLQPSDVVLVWVDVEALVDFLL